MLTRFRGVAVPPATPYQPNSFNPNIGKNWTIATDGARFNPFPDLAGVNVPTIYAATTYEAAALESVFHQVPHIETPEIMRSQVETWEYFELRTLRDLRVVRLTNPQLRQLKVSGRTESLREDELIHSPASQYPATRTWAKFLHDRIPGLDGLAWRPRLAGQGEAYVFFGDRCGSSDFEIIGTPTPLAGPTEYGKIKAVADNANVTIKYSK
jgi:RES domain